MRKVLKLLDDHFEEVIIVILLAIMTISIFYQVIMRYIFGRAPSWTEELTRYAFIWCAYFGVSLGVKRDAHISVLAAINLLPKKGQEWMHIVANLIFLVFSVIILKLGVDTMLSIARLGRRSAALEIPMWIVYAALPVGFVCIILRLCQAIFFQCKALRSAGAEDSLN